VAPLSADVVGAAVGAEVGAEVGAVAQPAINAAMPSHSGVHRGSRRVGDATGWRMGGFRCATQDLRCSKPLWAKAPGRVLRYAPWPAGPEDRHPPGVKDVADATLAARPFDRY
jgi:hypothetical protein